MCSHTCEKCNSIRNSKKKLKMYEKEKGGKK